MAAYRMLDILPLSVRSGFRNCLNGHGKLYESIEKWTIAAEGKPEVVKEKILSIDGILPDYSVISAEKYAIRMSSHEMCVRPSVKMTVNTAFRREKLPDVLVEDRVLHIKKTFSVRIPLKEEVDAGGEAPCKNVLATLVMVTAHCQLSATIPGHGVIKIPSMEKILAFPGSSLLSHPEPVSDTSSMVNTDVMPSAAFTEGEKMHDGRSEVKDTGMKVHDGRSEVKDTGMEVHDGRSEVKDTGQVDGFVLLTEEAESSLKTGEADDESMNGDEDKPYDVFAHNKTASCTEPEEKKQRSLLVEMGEINGSSITKRKPIPADITLKLEKSVKDANKYEGIESLEDFHPDDHFKGYDCCDVLLLACAQEDNTFLEEFRRKYSDKLVIKTIDDYHDYGIEKECEAIWRATKIIVYLTPEAEKFDQRLQVEVARTTEYERDDYMFIPVVPKGKGDEARKLQRRLSFLKQIKEAEEEDLLSENPENYFMQMADDIRSQRQETGKFVHKMSTKETKLKRSSICDSRSASMGSPDSGKCTSSDSFDPNTQSHTASSPSTTASSPDSGVVLWTPDDDEPSTVDVLCLCCDSDDNAAIRLCKKLKDDGILEHGKHLNIGTINSKFHALGISKVQEGLERAKKVILYASSKYADEKTATESLDWWKAINTVEEKLKLVVPKGVSRADFDGYKQKFALASAMQDLWEDDEEDMKALVEWFCESVTVKQDGIIDK